MTKEIFNSTLGISESDIETSTDIFELRQWSLGIQKDIININEKYDQNSNEYLIRDNQDSKEVAIAAHKALYALKRQELFNKMIENRIEELNSSALSYHEDDEL